MEVELTKVLPFAASSDAGWQVLCDVEALATCMPGAELTESLDSRHHKGRVKTKVGPVVMSFAGEIEIRDVNAEERLLCLIAKGQDSRGASTAQMDLSVRVQELESGGSELQGDAKIRINGRLASMGGRLISQVADQILDQFGRNFAAKAAAIATRSGTAPDDAAEAMRESAVVGPAAREPEALNGLALVWSVFVGYCKSLFGRK